MNIPFEEIARLFYRQVQKIHETEDVGIRWKCSYIFKCISKIFVLATQEEKLKFADLSTRIAFVGHRYNIPRQSLYFIYAFRKEFHKANSSKIEDWEPILYDKGLLAILESIKGITRQHPPSNLLAILPQKNIFRKQDFKVESFYPFRRVLVIRINEKENRLLAIDEENPDENIIIAYNALGRNDFFNPSIRLMKEVFGFPLSVNLLDVEVNEDGVYHPRGFVILPDYLIGITAISECFSHDLTDSNRYLLKKFIPVKPNKYLAIGNAANYFLDELLSDTDKEFSTLFKDIFNHNPIGFSTMDDQEIREILHHCRTHYRHLSDSIHNDFKEQGISIEDTYLEPTFYSREYGLQGRLDLWHKEEGGKARIVELKSGSPFKPNKQGLNINHYTQTLLYDLLVKSVYGKKINPTNFILYSKVEQSRLRFAQVSITHQMEALQIRNQIMAHEYILSGMDAENSGNLSLLHPDRCKRWSKFQMRDLEIFNKGYDNLSNVERKYFRQLTGFIAREHLTAKIGASKNGNIAGQANLWSKSLLEKTDDFEVLNQLVIQYLPSHEEEPILIFEKTEHTHPLANFRVGDICVLYPYKDRDDSILRQQVFKCTLLALQKNNIQVRLRAKQHNNKIFNEYKYWNIEHDLYDSSYNNQYKELLSFSYHPKKKRDIFLTIAAPSKAENTEVLSPPEMTSEQQTIFKRLVNQGDYFLLWGPPGTGKTNMMLKHLVTYLFEKTPEHILLLTFTNRAADEICNSINGLKENYFRIGSKYSTSPRFKDRLLNELIATTTTRKEVKSIIQKHRIVIGTVASILGKKNLLSLKKFDRVIIDEASQITEPMLCGLLPCFPKVLLIGDHKQLPAVTIQDDKDCKVYDTDLNELGIYDLRISLFERLYKRYSEMGYDYALARLSHQGRMHKDIMAFPNNNFYGGKLNILPDNINYHQEQIKPLSFSEQNILKQRVTFLPIPKSVEASLNDKTNEREAQVVLECIQSFKEYYGESFEYSKIGIITPFRAQIACIRHTLENARIPLDDLTIDTVERYQGGARDIIIISVCANNILQLGTIVSSNEDGSLDRKLNVALTRARHHLIVIGQPEILKYDKNYRAFLEKYSLQSVE